MRKRLLFISNLFPTEAEPYRGLDNAALLHALARDFEIKVLSPRPVLPLARSKPFAPRAGDAVLQPQWVPTPYVPKFGGPVNHRIMAAALERDFEKSWKNFRPDAVLSSWIFPDSCAAIRLVRDRAPLVAIAQGTDIHHYLEYPARRRIILKYLPRAAAVITRSGELSRLLERAGFPSSKLHTVYNGVSLETFQPRDKTAARRELALPETGPLILFVGNFYAVKAPDHLIIALSRMKTPGAHLVMAGGGELSGLCQSIAQKLGLTSRVTFAGRKSPQEIARLMNAADVLALPSRNEGVPNVILEAFASGLSVVASRVGGIPEVLDRDFLGRTFPAGDTEALAAALDQQLASPQDPAAIRRHGERFSWPACAARCQEILLSALHH